MPAWSAMGPEPPGSSGGAGGNSDNNSANDNGHLPEFQQDQVPLLSAQTLLMRLNTQALDLFAEGNEDQALDVLHVGIALGYRALVQGLTPAPRLAPRLQLQTLSLDEIVWPENGADVVENRLQASCFDYYPYIFLMEEVDDDADEEDQQQAPSMPCFSLAQVCVLLTYNLAMLHHKIGLVRHANNPLAPCFAKARAYYVAALQWWQAVADQEETRSLYFTHNMSPARLQMALYNNMGHLAASWGDDTDIIMCRQGLEQALVTATMIQRLQGQGNVSATTTPQPRSDSGASNGGDEGHAATVVPSDGDPQDCRFFYASLARARNHHAQNAPAA